MKSLLAIIDKSSFDVLQLIKLVVYSFLLINFVLYIQDDWVIASYTLPNGGSILEWTRAYAATIDETAWIVLLLLFELETYVMSDEAFTRRRLMLMHGARYVCIGFIGHSLYAYGMAIWDLNGAVLIADVDSLCQLIAPDVAHVFNLVYNTIDADNCVNLSSASQFYYIDPPDFIIVADEMGLLIEKQLAWIDFLEVVAWLFILLSIEMIIRLQDRGITQGVLLRSLNAAKFILYASLWLVIFYWLYRGHIMFAWDEFVWIAGFILIEANVVKWRHEIIEESESDESLATAS